MKKRVISALLTLVMVLSLLPAALAQDETAIPEDTAPEAVTSEVETSETETPEDEASETETPEDETPDAETPEDETAGDEASEDEPSETVPQTSFDDVAPKAWYHDAVIYVYDHGIMNGTKKNTYFSPEVTMSRAMLMTVLARYDGVDTTGGNTWFVKGQSWAVQNGVSNGVLPDADVTREQLVTMLWRYVGQPKSEETLNAFPDAGQASRYAQPALQWAVEVGLLTGKKNGLLEPKATASRAEVAAVLMRFCEGNFEKALKSDSEE